MGKSKKITEVVLSDKEKFLMHLSHQIRTPLYSISGISEILQSSGLDKQQYEYVSLINASINTITDLMESLMEFIQLENNTKTLKEDIFSIEEVIARIIQLHKPAIIEKKLKVNYFIDRDIPVRLRGDKIICQILINNIISNAVKYTYSGSIDIRVNLIEDKLQSSTIEIKVQDTGIGIAPAALAKLFDSDSTPNPDYTESITIPALGLRISQQFAALMKGHISVQSREGKGSTFTIQLQLRKELSRTIPTKVLSHEDVFFTRLNLLLVEDNRINQLVTQKLLRLHGINVDLADNGKIAVELLNSNVYDIILMDLQMPVMDGYATTRFIRESMAQHLSNIPIIAYTAHAFQGEAEKCFKAGMNDYITKPMNTDELMRKIAHLVPSKSNVYSKEMANQKSKEFKSDSIDLSYLFELSQGNTEFVREVVDVFVSQTPAEMLLAKENLDSRNIDEFYKIMHKLKPSLSLMGMHLAFEAVLEIQQLCKTTKEIPKLYDAFKKVQLGMDKAIPQLKQQLLN